MKTKHSLKTLSAITFVLLTSASQAAEEAKLSVTGTIEPAACSVALDTSVLDFGIIPYSSLSETDTTTLPGRTVVVTENCPSKQQVVWTPTDNRTSSASADGYGLGTAPNTESFGTYEVQYINGTLDGETAFPLYSTDKGATWTESAPVLTAATMKGVYVGATIGGTSNEDGNFNARVWVANIKVTPTLNTKTALSLTENATLDGSMTFNLVYL